MTSPRFSRAIWTEVWFAVIGATTVLAALTDRFLPPALALLLCDFVWQRRTKSRRITARTPLDLCLLLLVLALALTLWVTVLPLVTLPAVARALTGLLLYYALVAYFSPRADQSLAVPGGTDHIVSHFRLYVLALSLLALFLAFAALLTVNLNTGKLAFLSMPFFETFPRLGDKVHPNVMAGAILLLIPIPLALVLFGVSSPDPRRRFFQSNLAILLLALLSFFLILVLILTKSRGAYIGLAAALAVLAGLRWGARGWLAAGLSAFLLAGLLYFSPPTRAFLTTESNSAAATLESRLDIWSRAVFMLENFPLTGIGMSTFTRVADTIYPFLLNEPGTVPHAHNLFLQLGVDLGLPGLAAWLAAVFCAIWAAWNVYASPRPSARAVRGLAAGVLATLTALLVHGVVDAVTWGTRPSVIFWVIVALAVSLYRAFTPRANPYRLSPGKDPLHP